MKGKMFGSVVLASAMVLSAGSLFAAQSNTGAKQDMKNAGSETKDAAKDTGRGIKKGTKKAYHGTKRGTKKVVHATGHGLNKAGRAIEGKSQPN